MKLHTHIIYIISLVKYTYKKETKRHILRQGFSILSFSNIIIRIYIYFCWNICVNIYAYVYGERNSFHKFFSYKEPWIMYTLSMSFLHLDWFSATLKIVYLILLEVEIWDITHVFSGRSRQAALVWLLLKLTCVWNMVWMLVFLFFWVFYLMDYQVLG